MAESSCVPGSLESWIRATGNSPVKIADGVFFVKTRMLQKHLVVVIPIQAVEELGLETEVAYRLHMKSLETGRFFDICTMFKSNMYRAERSRWPLYGGLEKGCGIESGCKFYARIERADMDAWFADKSKQLKAWFESDIEKAPFEKEFDTGNGIGGI